MSDRRISNLVKSIREAAPRETLEKFDIGQIARTDDASDETPPKGGRSNSLEAFNGS